MRASLVWRAAAEQFFKRREYTKSWTYLMENKDRSLRALIVTLGTFPAIILFGFPTPDVRFDARYTTVEDFRRFVAQDLGTPGDHWASTMIVTQKAADRRKETHDGYHVMDRFGMFGK